MAQRILRPLDYKGIVDELFELYKNNFFVLAGIAGIVYLPINILCYVLGGKNGSGIATLLVVPIQFVIMAATTWAVSRIYLGETVTIADSYKAVWRRAFMLFWTLFMAGLLIYLGLIACLVPGIILAFRYAFVAEVYVLEGLSGKDGRVRSAFLAKGHCWRIFVVILLSTLVSLAVSAALTWPFQGVSISDAMRGEQGHPGILFGIMDGISMAITSPIQVLAIVLLYYDIRVRKEGFDIEMLASNMNSNAGEEQPAEQLQP